MKIIFVGKYDPDYNRTKIIIDGLKTFPFINLSFCRYSSIFKVNFVKLAKVCNEADIVFLPSFTHTDVPLIKILTKTPIIFDPLISRYLTKVFDYKKVSRFSPRAFKNFLKDKISMNMADLVLCDTYAHKDYFELKIGINGRKLKVLPVGVNTEEFKPSLQIRKNKFIVGFYGGFIPLQGTRLIIETAKLLQTHIDVQFCLIGEGFEFKKIRDLAINSYKLKNIDFLGWVNYNKLSDKINEFDISLGIFGETPKADLVIPNKIFHYASLKKAIITKKSSAIKEIFEENIDIIIADSPVEVAQQILELKNNVDFRNKIAENCYNKITSKYNHREIGRAFIEIAQSLLRNNKNPIK